VVELHRACCALGVKALSQAHQPRKVPLVRDSELAGPGAPGVRDVGAAGGDEAESSAGPGDQPIMLLGGERAAPWLCMFVMGARAIRFRQLRPCCGWTASAGRATVCLT
jgi:hypothetical protein